MPQTKIFKKNQFFFSKRGPEAKKMKIKKKMFRIEKGFKNWILNMCHMPPKKNLKKTLNFEFFLKEAPRGQKMKILKKYVQNQKGLQKLDIKHVPHAPKENLLKK